MEFTVLFKGIFWASLVSFICFICIVDFYQIILTFYLNRFESLLEEKINDPDEMYPSIMCGEVQVAAQLVILAHDKWKNYSRSYTPHSALHKKAKHIRWWYRDYTEGSQPVSADAMLYTLSLCDNDN
jgi:hypothetical protein